MAQPAQLTALQICIQAHCPAFLWGAPGIGKTAIIEQMAEGISWPLWTVILSIREPTDQGGLPVVRPDGVHMHPPLWAAQLVENGHGIVFMDEFNTAPPTVQSSALRVVHGGWAGDLKLPDATSFVAAGNPATTLTGGYDLTAAIANRWTHFEWGVDATEWTNGMVSGWPEVPIFRLPEQWREGVPAKRGLVSSFISSRSQWLLDVPADRSEQGGAWASPRTWERVAILGAAAGALGFGLKSEEMRILIRGCVGEAAAKEFTTYITNMDLRDAEEYLSNPDHTPLPTRQDQIMATLDSVAAAALSRHPKKNEQIDRYYAAWRVMGRVMRTKADIAIPAARVLGANVPPEVDRALPEEIDDLENIIVESGIDFSKAV